MKNFTISLFVATCLLFCVNKLQAQCTVNAGNDLTLYVGYPPLACGTLTASATGTAPFTFVWSNSATSVSITVCDNAKTIYWVTVTDSTGCTATDTVTVNAIDVRCGSRGNKVLVCHIPPGNPSNAHTICVSANAVNAHLNHGDQLGDCTPPPVNCTVNLGNDTTFCSGGSLTLDAGTGFAGYLWSDNSTGQTLTVTTSGTYWVQVSDPANNCTNSDTINVTVLNGPTVNAVADSLPDSLGCRNIIGSVTGGTPPYSISWSTGDTTLAIRVCDTVPAMYTLIVIDSNGCSGTVSVLLNPLPIICTVNLGSDASFCPGDSMVLDAGTGFTSYMWSDSTSGQTLSVSSTGTYWVFVTDSVRNCIASDSINISVFNAPVASAIADSLPDSLGCRNLTGSATGGTAPYTFIWSTGDTAQVIVVCDTVTTTYILTVVDTNGCSSVDSVTVTPVPPVICIVNLGADASFCQGDSLVLDAGTGFTGYMWSDSTTAQTLTVTSGGTYWVQVNDSVRNCTVSDSIIITVFSAPVASATADSLPDSLGCRNLNGSASGGTPPYTFIWSTGDTAQSILVCDTVTTTYALTVVDTNGCSSTDSVTFIPPPAPCLLELGSGILFCGDTLLLDAGPGYTGYMWSDSTTAQTLAVITSGTYWVQVTDSVRNCTLNDTIDVLVFDAPLATAVADTIVDSLGCRDIVASFTGGTPPYVYSWNNGDTSLIINVCDTVFTIYTFTVIDSNGCSSSATVIINDTTSARPVILTSFRYPGGVVKVLPNPVMNIARIGFMVPEEEKVKVDLYDMKGTLLVTLYEGPVKAKMTYTIDYNMDSRHEGIYLVRLTKSSGELLTTRLVLFKD